jgi:N-acetylmuramoyl-L-alanine amidase
MKTIKMWLPAGCLGRNQVKLDFKGVTIHNTDNSNPGADAQSNVHYMLENCHSMYNSWHYTVDDHQIVQSVPENEEAMHSGNRVGNHTTVAIEICQNSDGNILKATNTATQLAADILRRHGMSQAVWKQNIFQHHDWTGKDCPSQIRRGIPYDWTTFVNRVNSFLKRPALRRVLIFNPDAHLRGNDVRTAQERLKALGFYTGRADGIYGEQTYNAVRRFQAARGIQHRDGIIGPETWTELWQ